MTTDQKVALVTAGTAGLGAAICQTLARAGFRLVRSNDPAAHNNSN